LAAVLKYHGPMQQPGKILRRFREMWGLSIRDVEAKSELIAQRWGDKAYFIDSTYFNKIETGQHPILNVSMGKAVSMMEILSRGSGTLLKLCRPPRGHILIEDFLGGPQRTGPIEEGRLAEGFSQLLSAADLSAPIPQNTTLGPLPDPYGISIPHPFQDRKRYLRVIVGKSDLCLYPYVLPGTLLIVDRQYRRIPKDREFDNEFQRPIFLVGTQDGYFCCWCELIENSDMVKIVQFPGGTLPFRPLHHPLKLGEQIEIVGAVAYEGLDRRRYLEP
jgi:hypothetical protein